MSGRIIARKPLRHKQKFMAKCAQVDLMTALLLTQTLPAGYWPLEKSQPIIDKTQTIRLSGDISKLSEGERKAVAKLIEVGQIFEKLYEQQRHPEALSSYRALEQLDKRTGSTPPTQNLLTLYRLFQGPIATTLETNANRFCRSTTSNRVRTRTRGVSPKSRSIRRWDCRRDKLTNARR